MQSEIVHRTITAAAVAAVPMIAGEAAIAQAPSANSFMPTTLTSRPDSAKPKPDPFAFADFTWLNGNARTKESPLSIANCTGEFADISHIGDFNHPSDYTLVGTSESGRTSEIQLQFGMYSTMTPRSDANSGRGQWDLADAYRYLSDAYGGRHWDALNGINLDAGIFMSYVGLFSYYNFDNWAYQRSYVSSNTPWFFNGLRLQLFASDHLKIEPWLVNGWQSYGMCNEAPGHVRLHARAVHHVPFRGQSAGGQRALLRRPRRRDPARWVYRAGRFAGVQLHARPAQDRNENQSVAAREDVTARQ